MRKVFTFAVVLFGAALAAQQPAPYFTDAFPVEEFAARRARVMEQVGDGLALVQGAPEMSAEVAFRQNNQFFYLTGVEVPRALLVIDGRAKRSTLFLGPARRERYNGPELGPGPAAATMTGMEAVVEREQFAAALTDLVKGGRTIYTPFRAEVRGGGSGGEATGHARATAADPWDGRPSRETVFKQKVQDASPGPRSRISIRCSTRCVSGRPRARSR